MKVCQAEITGSQTQLFTKIIKKNKKGFPFLEKQTSTVYDLNSIFFIRVRANIRPNWGNFVDRWTFQVTLKKYEFCSSLFKWSLLWCNVLAAFKTMKNVLQR